MRTKSKTGPELLEEIGENPTLDQFLDRDPHSQPYTDEELLRQIEVERHNRLSYSIREDKS